MPPRDLNAWMWAEACEMLARAEGLQRRFFQPVPRRRSAAWEPPVDVYETTDGYWVLAALPGVRAERLEVRIEDAALVIAGERRLPAVARTAALQRIEIPLGRFERRLALPPRPLEITSQQLVDGCLYLQLAKL